MEEKMKDISLGILVKKIEDDLKDSWGSYNAAMEAKLWNNTRLADFCINDAKTRLKHSDEVKEEIAYIMKQDNVHENAFRYSYLATLENIENLKIKVSNFKL